MKTISRSTALLAFALIAGPAGAQDVISIPGTSWRGFYDGSNLGGAWNSTCNSWTPNNGISNPTIETAFHNRDCPGKGTFIGGVQLGYNFQKDQLVWGFGLDYEFLSGKNRYRSFTYAGAPPPVLGLALVSNTCWRISGRLKPNIRM
jgi:opacity protein-like surface antigen